MSLLGCYLCGRDAKSFVDRSVAAALARPLIAPALNAVLVAEASRRHVEFLMRTEYSARCVKPDKILFEPAIITDDHFDWASDDNMFFF